MSTPFLLPNNPLSIFTSFNLFELCVGIAWPTLSFLRSKYIPEKSRSTIMNLFRIPLNLLVIFLLWQNLSINLIFKICFFLLLIASLIQQLLYNLTKNKRIILNNNINESEKFSFDDSTEEEEEEKEGENKNNIKEIIINQPLNNIIKIENEEGNIKEIERNNIEKG